MNIFFQVLASRNGIAQEHVSFYVFYAICLLLLAALSANFGVTLTETDIMLRGLRWRRLSWHSVTAITQDHSMGARYVRIWTTDGRSRRLRAPHVPFLGIGQLQYERDFHVIGQWWLAQRHPDSG